MASSTDKWAVLTAADFIHLLRRRFISLLLTAALVTAVVAAVLVLMPNRYISEGMLFVRLGRGSVSLDPTSSTSATVSLQESRIAEVASVREMLASRAIAQRVVDAVGSDEILRPRTRTQEQLAHASEWIRSLSPLPHGGDNRQSAEQYALAIEREEAIHKVRESMLVSVPHNTYSILIEAKFDDPYLARDVVQAAMQEYRTYHVEAHRAIGSVAFFEQQHEQSLVQAMQAQQALREAKNRMGLLSAELEEASLQERISKLELARDQTLAELSASQAEVEKLNGQLDSLMAWIPTTTTKGVANGAGDGMRQALYALEIQERAALATLHPSHPRYKALQEQVAQSAEIVEQQATERPLTVEALNPIRQNLETSAHAGLGRIAGLQAKQESIESNLSVAQSALQQLNQDALELSELTRTAMVAEANYLKHAKSLEEARVLHALDSEGMSDVSIIQPAPLMLKKIGPPRTFLLLLGALLGVCLGGLQAILREGSPQVRSAPAEALRPSARAPRRGTSGLHQEQDIEHDAMAGALPR